MQLRRIARPNEEALVHAMSALPAFYQSRDIASFQLHNRLRCKVRRPSGQQHLQVAYRHAPVIIAIPLQ